MVVISVPIVTDRTTRSTLDGFERIGSFRYLKVPDRWEWSDAVARMHGYRPGEVVPTTELILSHKHPDDKPAVSEIIEQVLRHGAAFSSRHRIIDTAGNVHVVVVVGYQLVDASGQVIGTSGFYIDVTDAFQEDMQKSVTQAVAEVEELARGDSRSDRHHPHGVRGVRGARFEVLTWRSQQTNVKLRRIAEQFVRELAEKPLDAGVRAHIDHVLLTAHRANSRVSGSAAAM